jgi:peptide/nickel transport system permease protein/glutathione transport system permease protein
LLIVVSVAFFVLRMTGDTVHLYVDLNSTPEQEELIRQQLGLDRPLWVQYFWFIGDILKGEFGESLQYHMPALDVVLGRVGMTLQLVACALVLALIVGVLLGIVAAVYKDRFADLAITTVAVTGQSMPSFWLGILLVQIFALNLGWLPTSGTGTWMHLVLPSVTLAAFLMPNLILLTRTSVLEVSNELYVTTARSKGVPRLQTMFRHILPNSVNPIISFFGVQMGRLVGGSVVTETIFAWPGVGRLMVGSIFQRDVPVVVAAVVIVSLSIVLANLLVDILQSLADPRVRLE